MDAEIPQLGPGTGSADRPVRRPDQQLSVKKEGTADTRHLPSQPYSFGICIIAGKPQPYSGGRVWAEPTKDSNIQMPVCHAKIFIRLNKPCIIGYTIIKIRNRQLKSHRFDSRKLHIESLSGELKFHRHKIIYALQTDVGGQSLIGPNEVIEAGAGVNSAAEIQ